MKIYFQNPYTTKHTSFSSAKTVFKKSVAGNSRELANRLMDIKNANMGLLKTPIKNDEEFNSVFRRIVHDISYGGEYIWYTEKDSAKYKNIDKIDRGLIPYCGFGPGFKFINMFLSGRIIPEIIERYKQHFPVRADSFIDVIRTLEYSLKNLDKKYGKYQGIVYRQGYMSEAPQQYISTTKKSVIATALYSNNIVFSPNRGYSVIRVRNGHKINDFQRAMDSVFATNEEEILLSYQTKYKKVSPNNMDNELIKAKEEMASKLFMGAEEVINGSVAKAKGYTKKELLDMIDVYEEI